MCHTICVLNVENTLLVELQFELGDLHMRFWFYQQIAVLNILLG